MRSGLFLSSAFLAVLAVPSFATITFDTVSAGGSPTFSGTLPGSYIGDSLTLPTIGSGLSYRIDRIEIALIQRANSPALSNVVVNARAFGTSTSATTGTAAVFGDQRSNVNWTIGSLIAQPAAVFYSLDLNYATAGLSFNLPTGSNVLGLVLGGLQDTTTPSTNLTFGLIDRASSVAGSGSINGFYRNVANTGNVIGSDFRNFTGFTNTNLWVRVNATVVPEPASMAVMGFGLAALRRRRRG